MTEVTIREIAKTDLPFINVSGTSPKRRAMVSIRYTSASSSDTITLATYLPGVADVEGVVYDTMDNAVSATSVTWSTTTITAAGDTGSHKGEVCVIVNFT